jgi:hypothetical protein
MNNSFYIVFRKYRFRALKPNRILKWRIGIITLEDIESKLPKATFIVLNKTMELKQNIELT